jgi:hypothetical protein
MFFPETNEGTPQRHALEYLRTAPSIANNFFATPGLPHQRTWAG